MDRAQAHETQNKSRSRLGERGWGGPNIGLGQAEIMREVDLWQYANGVSSILSDISLFCELLCDLNASISDVKPIADSDCSITTERRENHFLKQNERQNRNLRRDFDFTGGRSCTMGFSSLPSRQTAKTYVGFLSISHPGRIAWSRY